MYRENTTGVYDVTWVGYDGTNISNHMSWLVDTKLDYKMDCLKDAVIATADTMNSCLQYYNSILALFADFDLDIKRYTCLKGIPDLPFRPYIVDYISASLAGSSWDGTVNTNYYNDVYDYLNNDVIASTQMVTAANSDHPLSYCRDPTYYPDYSYAP